MAKAEQVRQAEMNTILKMLMSSHTDPEIINELKIPPATFYRYKARIYKEYSDRFLQQRASDVGFHTEQLYKRLTRYLKIVEKKLEGCNDKEVAELAQVSTEIARMIFDLGLQGLEILNDVRVLDNKMQSMHFTNGDNNNDDIKDSEDQQTGLLQQNQTA